MLKTHKDRVMKNSIIVLISICIIATYAQADNLNLINVSSQENIEHAKSVLKTFQKSVFKGCVKRAETMGHVGKKVEKYCLCAAMVASQCVDMDMLLKSGEIKLDNKEFIERTEKECSY